MVRPRTTVRILVATGIAALLVITAYMSAGAVSAPQQPELRLMQARTASGSQVGRTETTFSERVLQLVNRRRAAHDLRPVRLNACVDDFSHHWADRLVRRDQYEHSDLEKLLDACDSGYVSENIAQAGPGATPRELVRLWMHSAGHRANILSRRVTASGVSVRWDANRGTWIAVQNFARRPGSFSG
ncbi:MAG TPA: CAP domain-containing protein [Nocardioidaceae bacterium]|jgi:uncharacterized protein YkwD